MNRTTALVAIAVLVIGYLMWHRIVDSMLFHPEAGVQIRPEQLGLAGEEVFFEASDGVQLHAFWLPAEGAGRALLFLHGNAGNASHRLPNAAELVALGTSVLLLDYRGYGRSQGRPGEAGVYLDARAGIEWLADVKGFGDDRIVVFGRSLGGAVAVDLLQDRPVAGVILESTFTSLGDMARSILGGPAAALVRGRFDSVAKIASLRAPLLFFHGDRDEIVPYTLGRALFDAAPEPKAFETLTGAGHNDTTQVGGRPYFERIGRFLDEVAPRG